MSTHRAQKLHLQHGLAFQSRDVLIGLLALRFINALCTNRTFFQPDEYFQALEPAWNLAFGHNSGAWMTWEWQYRLRSSLHPALFAVAYMAADKVMGFLQCLPPCKAFALAFLPKAVQALLAVLGDFYTWRLAEKIYGQGSKSAWSTLCITVLNPWQWYCSTRTFSNSLELTLTIMALNFWPWELVGNLSAITTRLSQGRGVINNLRISLLLAATAVLLRPTNVFIWLAIVMMVFTRVTLTGKSPITFSVVFILVREAVPCGTAALALSAVSDRLYFGEWTFPPYHWLHFNLTQDLAVFYGEMEWHYYLSQGITQLTMTFLPFALIGLYKSVCSPPVASIQQSNILKTLSITVVITVATLSLIAHKEVRFIYPLLPVLHILAAPFFASFFTASSPGRDPSQVKIFLLAALLFVNVVIAAYLSLFHAAAPISVMHFLRHDYERIHPDHLGLHHLHPLTNRHYHTLTTSPSIASTSADDPTDPTDLGIKAGNGSELFALFLTPCHTTPWRSHLIYPSLRARALTCEPPLDTAPQSAERANYQDETKRFYAHDETGNWGTGFLAKEMWPLLTRGESDDKVERGGEIPRYIVGFQSIESMLIRFFDEEAGAGKNMGVKLRRVWKGWNGLFSDDERKEGYLIVWDTGVYLDTKSAS